jgi:hypothetical protein
MGRTVINRIHESVETKPHYLDEWLETAPLADDVTTVVCKVI